MLSNDVINIIDTYHNKYFQIIEYFDLYKYLQSTKLYYETIYLINEYMFIDGFCMIKPKLRRNYDYLFFLKN